MKAWQHRSACRYGRSCCWVVTSFRSLWQPGFGCPARAGHVMTLAALSALLPWAMRFIMAFRFRLSLLGALLHPLGVAALVAIQWIAFFRWRVRPSGYVEGPPGRLAGRCGALALHGQPDRVCHAPGNFLPGECCQRVLPGRHAQRIKPRPVGCKPVDCFCETVCIHCRQAKPVLAVRDDVGNAFDA
jgi:hypothetical protein